MSDFENAIWDWFIAITTVVSVVACALFLFSQSKRRVKVGAQADPDTTGHVWDGDLQEFHNPLPRWWSWLFYLTVVFALLYLALYPGLGTGFKGMLNWTSTAQHGIEVKAAEAKYGPIFLAYLDKDLAAVAADERGRQMGERIFQNNCAQCHGSDGRGSRGFPNLADSEWQWGAGGEAIKTAIVEGRVAAMPPMGAAVGGAADVGDVAHYVLSLSDSAHDSVRAARGKDKFAVCVACHGADGKGNPALGAPDLTNRIWMYGGNLAAISETISRGRGGVMPAWKGILTDAEIHLVAAYVLSLSKPAQQRVAQAPPAR
jgi:cytochrome c oxidase cbb3-type subunit III